MKFQEWVKAISIAFILTLAIVLLHGIFSSQFVGMDKEYYVQMVKGYSKDVTIPFAQRALYAFMLKILSVSLGIDNAFVMLGIFGVFVFFLFTLASIRYCAGYGFFLATAFIFTPVIFQNYHILYNPAMLFAGLSSAYFFALLKEKYLLSLLLLFPLFFIRQEAIIIAFSFIAAVFMVFKKNAKKASTYIFIAAMIISISYLVLSNITRNNTNIHHMPHSLWVIARMPVFALRNFLGIEFWVDTYRNRPLIVHEPIIAFNAPSWLSQISSIKQIGIYEFNCVNIIRTIIYIISLFGTGPILISFFIFARRNFFKYIKNSTGLITAFLSAATGFMIGPFLGPSSARYYINAWPLFFIIMPFFLKEIILADRESGKKIVLCYFISSWLFYLPLKESNVFSAFLFFVAEFLLYRYSWHLLSSIYVKPNRKFYAVI